MPLVSPEGLRADARRPNQVRRLVAALATHNTDHDGSAALHMGNTKVLAVVNGPAEKKQHNGAASYYHSGSGSAAAAAAAAASIACELIIMPFATGQYVQHTKTSKQALEIANGLRSIFEHVVQTHLYPRSEIFVSITATQIDGGLRSACINVTTLALINAGIAMQDFVCACSVGLSKGSLLLDLTALESAQCSEVSLSLLPRDGRIASLELESKAPLHAVEEALALASEGCRQVYEVLRDCVRVRTGREIHLRGVSKT